MLPVFERTRWESELRWPDWYCRLERELRAALFPVVHDAPQLKAWRHQVYHLAGEMLARGEIPLASAGPDLDEQRRLPDTIVLHHTEEEPDLPLEKLNAIGLLRQYGLQYLENNVLGHAVRGQPVWSGHFRLGRMVFFAYHWLVRPDGTCTRLLEDRAIGWHAGNWKVNTRSIGIALSGNYEHAAPPAGQIQAAAHLVSTHYPAITPRRMLGHCEVRAHLTCPGDRFLAGWKMQFLRYLHA
ncbi:MAG TPA: peptidoglycan recognition family protein [Ktedonobacteraceae bacterium]|jgi:hypothetical protein